MNGRGGSAYNKSSSAKRKPSSLVLSRAVATGGAGVVVSGNLRHKNHDLGAAAGGSGGSGSGVRVGPRGGQLQLQAVSRAPPPSAGGAVSGHNSNTSEQSADQRQQRWGAGQSQAHQRQSGTAAGAGNANARASNNGYQHNREQQHANNQHQGGRQPQLQKQQQRHQQHQQRQAVQAKSSPVSGNGSAGVVREGQGGHEQSSASLPLPRAGRSSGAGETAHAGRGAPRAGEDWRGKAASQQLHHQQNQQQQQRGKLQQQQQPLPPDGVAQDGAGQRQGRSGPDIRSQNQGQQHRPQASSGARASSQGMILRPGASRMVPTGNVNRGQQQQHGLVSRSQMQQQHQGQAPSQPRRHPHSNGNAAAAAAPTAGPNNVGRDPPRSSASNGQVVRAGGAVPPNDARQHGPSEQRGDHGNTSVVRAAAPGAGSATPTAAAAIVGGAADAHEPQPSLASPSITAAVLTVGSSAVAAAAGAAPEGEAAALRARLAEAEAKNAEALARVRELEENNFDLEAAMQMVEVEASHRVEKEAKALQSELTFKTHQLTVAQKDHTSAVRELNAERAKRKRDSQQAARERQDAVAKAAAAAAATAAAGAAEAAAAEAAAAAAAAAAAQDASLRSLNGKEREQRASMDDQLRHEQQLEEDKRAALLPPPLLSPTTLAEAILSESSEDVMVLLSAGGSAGAAAASRHLSAAADDEPAEEGGGDSSESDGDQNNGYWHASPRRRRGSDADIGGGQGQELGGACSPPAPDSSSPVRLAPWEHRLGAEKTPTTVRGSSSSSRPACGHAGGAGFSAGRYYSDTGYLEGGAQSPQRFWGAGGEEGFESDADDDDDDDDDGDAKSDEALEEELRGLSSQMFSCALGLLEGEACAGDLLDVLVGFLEVVPGETEYELDVLVSAARLVHRALEVTPPAALAVALADGDDVDNHDHDTTAAAADAPVDDGDGGGAAIPVDRKLGLDEEDRPVAVEATAAAGKGKGKGKKRGRSEIGVTDASSAEEREVRGDELDEDDGSGEKQGRRHHSRGGAGSGGSSKGRPAAESCPFPSLFVAGQPVTAEATGVDAGADTENGASRASASVFAPSSAYRRRRRLSNPPTVMASMSAVWGDSGRRRGGEPQTASERAHSSEAGGERADVGWAGTRKDGEARELCRRVKGRLVGLFHRGAMYGCSALVEVCLQAILSVVWDRKGEELRPWGGLVALGSFNQVMSSDLFRPAWELGAEIVRVLFRNANLFRAIASAAAVEGEAGQKEGSLEQQAALETAGEAAVAGKPRTARTLSLPTPGGFGGVQDGLGGAGAADLEDEGTEDCGDSGDSLLRRLCLDAVAVGEHAPFGENIGLRLSIIRLVLSACQTYGVEAARPLFGGDGLRGGSGGDGDGDGGRLSSAGRRVEVGGEDWEEEEGEKIIPALVNFVHLELEDWERRRYSEANPIESDRSLLLKEGFQLLWALAMHSPLSLRDMAQGAGMYNTLVSVVSRFYNSVELEKFQVHAEAMMLMEKME